MNYFPSAVPESPLNGTTQSVFTESSISFHPSESTLKSMSRNSLQQFTLQQEKISRSNSKEATLVISVGPSRDPAPLVRLECCDSINDGLSCTLITESKQIQSQFSEFILAVCSLLQNYPAAHIDKLRMWLSFQSCSQAVQSLKAFDPNSDMANAKSIPTFISSLHKYTSWYNYDLIADIAKKFCGDKGSALVEKYEETLKNYLHKLILYCPPLHSEYNNLTQDTEMLKLKITQEISSVYLKDITIFKHTLCKLCELDPRFLILRRIENSDFQMLWAFPRSAAESTIKAINSKSDASAWENIEAIQIGNSQINKKVS